MRTAGIGGADWKSDSVWDSARRAAMLKRLSTSPRYGASGPSAKRARDDCDKYNATLSSHRTDSPGIPLARDAQEGYDNWQKAVSCYTNGSAPPHYPASFQEYVDLVPHMARATAYYYPTHDELAEVHAYASCRWPCAMGVTILTDRDAFREAFPWMPTESWYRETKPYIKRGGRPVQMGVLTVAPTYANDTAVHVFHMIAPDLGEDNSATLDAAYFSKFNDSSVMMYELAKWHARSWYMAFRAAQELGLKKVAMSMPGGGQFWPRVFGNPDETFVPKVFKVAMALLETVRKDCGITMVEPPVFPDKDAAHRRVTQSLREDVLYVNAWCHSAFVGNGNKQDPTLDGGWGRVGPLAVMAWPPSNPFLGYKGLAPPDLPLNKPTERSFARSLPTVLAPDARRGGAREEESARRVNMHTRPPK